MKLDERKNKILKAVVEDYIKYAEPVGSKTLVDKHKLGYSSATIRNEMALLETEGYLEQPHTSAGRVPSSEGYRYYVDNLMKNSQLSMVDIDYINNSISGFGNVDELISQTSEILSKVLNQPTLVNITTKDVLESVKVINISEKLLLIVLISQTGMIKDCIVKLHKNLSDEIVEHLNSVFNNTLKGVPIDNIKSVIYEYINNELKSYSDIVSYIVDEICQNIDCDKKKINDNIPGMLALPEFSDIGNVKKFVELLSTEKIFENVKKYSETNNLTVIIGNENEEKAFKDYSIVSLNINLENKQIANIGVIGPKRMDYKRTLSIMKYLGEKLKEVLNIKEKQKEDKDV